LYGLGSLLYLRVEECFRCDTIRKFQQFAVQVTYLSWFPAVEHPRSLAHHNLAVTGEPLGTKGWSCKSTLSVPKLPFTRQQSVSKQRYNMAPENTMLDKLTVVLNKHALGVMRIIQEYRWPCAKPHSNNIAISVRTLGEEAKCIPSDIHQVANEWQPSRTWRSHCNALGL